MRNKKIAFAAVFLAVTLIIGIVESYIPPIFPFLPYIRLGFSNVVVLCAIIFLNFKYAACIVVLKSVLVPVIVGNPMMIAYSLPSSVLALAVSCLLLYSKKFGIPAVSTVSSIVHNFIQLSVAAIFTSAAVYGYAPYFIVIGAICGLVIGFISYFVVRYFPKKLLP